MKLWLDDIRPAPDGWVWAKNVSEAQAVLVENYVEECSLDHDLGFEGVEMPDDPDELAELLFAHRRDGTTPEAETGLDLVLWMVETSHVPPRITIHSWNPDGADAMQARLNWAGYGCSIEPYEPKGEAT